MDDKIKSVKGSIVKKMSGLLKEDKKMDSKMSACKKGMKKLKSKKK